jgi:hypothetical protein
MSPLSRLADPAMAGPVKSAVMPAHSKSVALGPQRSFSGYPHL